MDRSSGKSMREVYVQGLRNVLDALPSETGRLIYISSTGVYGQTDGSWVDEESPCQPERDSGQICLEAEQTLLNHRLSGRSVILRLAGIYGPGRIPYIDKIRQGEPIAAPSAGWLNLIHVDDAASVVAAAAEWVSRQADDGPHLFCVSDGQPVVRANYYREVARLIGADPPQFTDPDPASPAALRAGADRRISSDKLLSALGIQLAYPSYREGLAAILSDNGEKHD